MSAISAAMVKELREKTGAGMLDCKNALTETNGDMEKAVEELRKKGVASAAKKASRLASEGLVHIYQTNGQATIVEVNCETDFVAKNEDFQAFLKLVAARVAETQPKDLAELMNQEFSAGKTTEQALQELIAKIGENLSVRRFATLKAEAGQLLGAYTHMGSKIGTLVLIQGDSGKIDEETQKGVAMHVAAAAPRFLKPENIPQEILDKEKEIYEAQLKDSGKPAEMLEKILPGKLKKFASEVCLTEQIYIRDPNGKNSVVKFLKSLDPQAEVIAFVRYQVGEGLEKKQEDFAAEVAKQMGK